MKLLNIFLVLVAVSFLGFLPCHSQRISVGKKGHVKVMRTDSTSAREFVRDQGGGSMGQR